MSVQLVIPTPTARDILSQITPFVINDKHELEFEMRFRERRGVAQTLVDLAKAGNLSTEPIVALISKNSQTLNVLISLLGISQEEFFRHVTLARLDQIRETAATEESCSEWKMDRINSQIVKDKAFADATFALLLNGVRDASLARRVPRFLFAKLDGSRLATIGDGGIDPLIRIGLKGAYDAKKGQPVADEVAQILQRMRVKHIAGETTVPNISRRMDMVIPHQSDPHVLIEVGVFATTARELSEKGLVEQVIRREVEQHYPHAVLVRVVDGVGWIARGGNALKNVIAGSHYVFTQKTLPDLERVIRTHVPQHYFE